MMRARPAWDIALGEKGSEALDAAKAEVIVLIRQWLGEFAKAFQRALIH